MAEEKECVLLKSGKAAQACDVCKIDRKSTKACALANLSAQEAMGLKEEAPMEGALVVPPMGGPKFKAALEKFPNAANHLAALHALLIA